VKILQAFDFLSLPHGGGTVDIVYKLSKALANRGHDVTICTGDHEIDYHYLNGLGDVGIKVFHSRFNKHGFYLMPDIASLDISEYDVIHLHCYRSFQNTILCRTAYKQGIPYIIDAHGSTVARSGIKRPILEAYDWVFGRTTINQAQFVIAETEIGVAEWEKLGADKRKIRIQHPLLDTSEFAVLPEAETVDIEISPNDLKIDVYHASGHGGQSVNTTDSAVRITHLPTNTVVTCQDEKSQIKNKAKAMQILRSRVLAAEQERLAKERGDERKSQIGTGDRSEKIRTYNFPQDRITDHRVSENFSQIEKIMDGDIQKIIDKLKEADK